MNNVEKIREEIKTRFEMLTARSSDENGFAYGVAADQLLSLLVFIDTLGDDGSAKGDVRPPCVHYSEVWGCATSPMKVCSFCHDYVPSVDTGCAEGGEDDATSPEVPDEGVPDTLEKAADYKAEEAFEGVRQFKWGREHVKHLIRQAVKYGANWQKERDGERELMFSLSDAKEAWEELRSANPTIGPAVAFIRGVEWDSEWKKRDRDEWKEKERTLFELFAVKLAIAVYDRFFNELMTSFTNIIRNLNGARFQVPSAASQSYFTGKMQAFQEIAERIQKEYGLSRSSLDYYLKKYGDIVKDRKFSCMTFQELDEIRMRKNDDVDKMLDANVYKGTQVYDYIERVKARIANHLEDYASEGFRLGMLFRALFDGAEISGDMTVDEVKAVIDRVRGDLGGGFDPKRFESECVDMFIPPQWKKLAKSDEGI